MTFSQIYQVLSKYQLLISRWNCFNRCVLKWPYANFRECETTIQVTTSIGQQTGLRFHVVLETFIMACQHNCKFIFSIKHCDIDIHKSIYNDVTCLSYLINICVECLYIYTSNVGRWDHCFHSTSACTHFTDFANKYLSSTLKMGTAQSSWITVKGILSLGSLLDKVERKIRKIITQINRQKETGVSFGGKVMVNKVVFFIYHSSSKPFSLHIVKKPWPYSNKKNVIQILDLNNCKEMSKTNNEHTC